MDSKPSAPVPAAAGAPPREAAARHAADGASPSLWVDKYAPKVPSEYIGNAREMNALAAWLQDWDSVHINKSKVVKAGQGGNAGAKAALLSGPPGIGELRATAPLAELQ